MKMSKDKVNALGFMAYDDEEEEEYGSLKKANSRKSLAPLYVYEILKDNTNRVKHFKQQDIIDRLEEYPYELSLERKAVGRILHLLEDEYCLDICLDKATGAWYEKGSSYRKAC